VTGPIVVGAVFWAFRHMRPDSILDRSYGDQAPWTSAVLAGMFSLQGGLFIIQSSGTLLSRGSIAYLSIALLFGGAATAMLARIHDRLVYKLIAAAFFLYNVWLYVQVWDRIAGIDFVFSCEIPP
jgi:hypothetical protein